MNPFIIWFTGLSGSGKSTLAKKIQAELLKLNIQSLILDGDELRSGLSSDLCFCDSDRNENNRRAYEIAKLVLDQSIIPIVCLISPFKRDREFARAKFKANEFVEIYLNTPIDICSKRDPKNLYKKVNLGEIKNFTGLSSLYEKPDKPEITINTSVLNVDDSIKVIMNFLKKNFSID